MLNTHNKAYSALANPGNAPGNSKGFTLIELMIVLVIVAIVILIALPSFSVINLNTKLKSYSNEMVASVYLARGEAIKRNGAMTLCISDDGATCKGSGSWDEGWIVISSTAPNEVVRTREPLSNGFRFTSSASGAGNHTMTFQPSGTLNTSATFTLCRKTPTVGEQQRQVSISATGRTKVNKTTSTTCT
jgi:type IV fimbrial biogenesis protein FimT